VFEVALKVRYPPCSICQSGRHTSEDASQLMALDTYLSGSIVLGQLEATGIQYRNAEHTPEINLYQENLGLFWMGRHEQ
jgi:hypothetical protein